MKYDTTLDLDMLKIPRQGGTLGVFSGTALQGRIIRDRIIAEYLYDKVRIRYAPLNDYIRVRADQSYAEKNGSVLFWTVSQLDSIHSVDLNGVLMNDLLGLYTKEEKERIRMRLRGEPFHWSEVRLR